MHPAIHIENISKRYRAGNGILKSHLALDRISLTVNQGEVFGFLGPNGAGKTSLIKIIVGIMKADQGACRIFGHAKTGADSHTRDAKLRLGYLPEHPYFHDFLTAAEFLRFHGNLLGMSHSAIDHRTSVLLEKLNLSHARDQRLRTFSKGMLQRVGFAQALLHDPDILVLDEPMSGLDPVGRREVRDIITEVSKSGKTVFFSTHIIHDVEVICSTVGFINQGKLKGSGSIESLLGKTVRSMEIRYALDKDPSHIKPLKNSRKTMDGWVLDLEAPSDKLETHVNAALASILDAEGVIQAVVPRKSTLEDLFFGESK